jgi:hypothetical protein
LAGRSGACVASIDLRSEAEFASALRADTLPMRRQVWAEVERDAR